MNNTEYLSTSEAARILGCSSDGVRYLSKNGQLPTALQTGAGRVFLRADVERYAATRAERAQHHARARGQAAARARRDAELSGIGA